MSDGVRSHRLGPPLLAALLVAGPVQAQIVTDGSVGPKVSLSGGEIKIGANLGTRSGDNLFHSFEKFGIATGQTATFTGPGDIRNVISRVTGGERSTIRRHADVQDRPSRPLLPQPGRRRVRTQRPARRAGLVPRQHGARAAL